MRLGAEQDMVGRSELAAALSEAKACREEAAAKTRTVQGLEEQLGRLGEQLRDAQAALREMVPQTELTSALTKLAAADEAASVTSEQHREEVSKLKAALAMKQSEASSLRAVVQVRRMILGSACDAAVA